MSESTTPIIFAPEPEPQAIQIEGKKNVIDYGKKIRETLNQIAATQESFWKLWYDWLSSRFHLLSNKQFLQWLYEANGDFQLARALVRLTTLGYSNTVSPDYAHPVADSIRDAFGDINLGLDEDGSASSLAFTILSLVYLPFLLVIALKYRQNGFNDLPHGISYAIREAMIWGSVNIAMAVFSYHPEVDGNVCDLSVFGLFSVAIILDTINSAHEQTLAIRDINEQLNNLRKLDVNDENQTQNFSKDAELIRKLTILQFKRVSTIGFGISATGGGACVIASNALTLAGSSSAELIADLTFSGMHILSGVSLLFAVIRWVGEMISYGIEHHKLTLEIAEIDKQILAHPAKITQLTQDKQLLLGRQEDIQQQAFNSTCYYVGLIVVLTVSVLTGPVGGLIAFGALVLAQQLLKHTKAGKSISNNAFKATQKLYNSVASLGKIPSVIKNTLAPLPLEGQTPPPQLVASPVPSSLTLPGHR